MLRILKTLKPELTQVLQHYFRSDYSIYIFLKREINYFQDHALYLRFVGTFSFLSFNDSSSSGLLKRMPSNEKFSSVVKLTHFRITHVMKFGGEMINLGLVKQ